MPLGAHDELELHRVERILGDVPVEADGSAYFAVPADKFIFFQALDGNKMMVQSMRSGTTIMPGETQGCIGCHDHRDSVVPNRDVARCACVAHRAASSRGTVRRVISTTSRKCSRSSTGIASAVTTSDRPRARC